MDFVNCSGPEIKEHQDWYNKMFSVWLTVVKILCAYLSWPSIQSVNGLLMPSSWMKKASKFSLWNCKQISKLMSCSGVSHVINTVKTFLMGLVITSLIWALIAQCRCHDPILSEDLSPIQMVMLVYDSSISHAHLITILSCIIINYHVGWTSSNLTW